MSLQPLIPSQAGGRFKYPVKDEPAAVTEDFTFPTAQEFEQDFGIAQNTIWVNKRLPEGVGESFLSPTDSYVSLATPRVGTLELSSARVYAGVSPTEPDYLTVYHTEPAIIQTVRDFFSQVDQVSHVFYAPYLEGLRFFVLLAPKEYDKSLLNTLYSIEHQIRASLHTYEVIPFEINYAFNSQAFDVESIREDMHLIHEK